jgi:hypothetical protein
VKRFLFGVLITLLAVGPAAADIRIMQSPGGQIGTFLKLFTIVRESGQRVVIDGPCLSACTLVVSMVPSGRICVTHRAVLGFHAAWSKGRGRKQIQETEATKMVLAAYPQPIQNWIGRHGGLNSKPIFLKGRELMAMYPTCR